MQGAAGPKAWGGLAAPQLMALSWPHGQLPWPLSTLAVMSSWSPGKAVTARPSTPLLLKKLNFEVVVSNSPGGAGG